MLTVDEIKDIFWLIEDLWRSKTTCATSEDIDRICRPLVREFEKYGVLIKDEESLQLFA